VEHFNDVKMIWDEGMRIFNEHAEEKIASLGYGKV
jgi:hypothetical protein